MNAHKMFRSFLFACMGIVMAACANVQTQPTALASDTAAPTATVATATAPAPTETATIAPTEAPQIPPEILTAVDVKDARNKILPYCKTHADLSDGPDADKVYYSVKTIPNLWKLIESKLKNHEIAFYGGSVVNQSDGSGGCIVVPLYKNGTTMTGIIFESRFDESWVEVKIVSK
jgi:hypothetical protein